MNILRLVERSTVLVGYVRVGGGGGAVLSPSGCGVQEAFLSKTSSGVLGVSLCERNGACSRLHKRPRTGTEGTGNKETLSEHKAHTDMRETIISSLRSLTTIFQVVTKICTRTLARGVGMRWKGGRVDPGRAAYAHAYMQDPACTSTCAVAHVHKGESLHYALLLDMFPPKSPQANPLEMPLELGDPNCPNSIKLQTTFASHNKHHAHMEKP